MEIIAFVVGIVIVEVEMGLRDVDIVEPLIDFVAVVKCHFDAMVVNYYYVKGAALEDAELQIFESKWHTFHSWGYLKANICGNFNVNITPN